MYCAYAYCCPCWDTVARGLTLTTLMIVMYEVEVEVEVEMGMSYRARMLTGVHMLNLIPAHSLGFSGHLLH